MPFIENVSRANLAEAYHFDPGPNSVLIMIVDPDMSFVKPKYPFGEIHKFKFLDEEKPGPQSICEAEAEAIADILKAALEKRSNVIVSCVAGLCRSGAVVQAGINLGFTDTEVSRSPNLRVKNLIEKALGLEVTGQVFVADKLVDFK